jgi:hypothetical protein
VVRVEDGTTRVRLMPVTGRTHQLRVHMAAIGHPILGDTIYAEGAAREFPRLMLHAESLRIRHPEAGQELYLHGPGAVLAAQHLPADPQEGDREHHPLDRARDIRQPQHRQRQRKPSPRRP